MIDPFDMKTLDLFAPLTGLEIGHAKAKIAADHAGEEWKKTAYNAFLAFAKLHDKFKTEDVRNAYPDIPPPPDKRAWGQIALQAKKDNKISSAGFTRAESKSVHGMVVTLWQSKIYENKEIL
jgi:hypothetical protein